MRGRFNCSRFVLFVFTVIQSLKKKTSFSRSSALHTHSLLPQRDRPLPEPTEFQWNYSCSLDARSPLACEAAAAHGQPPFQQLPEAGVGGQVEEELISYLVC